MAHRSHPLSRPAHHARLRALSFGLGLLVLLGHSDPARAARLDAPAPLPDWDGAKKDPPKKDPPKSGDKKPSDLPDWDAEVKKKPDDKPAKKPAKPASKKPSKPKPSQEAPVEPAPEPPAEPAPEAPTPAEAQPAAPAEPAAPAPHSAAELAADPAYTPAATLTDRRALNQAKGELIVGGVLAAGGLAGLGVMAAGLGQDDPERRERLVAAGAVAGLINLAMGLALIGQGAKDLRDAKRQLARVRLEPTLTGLRLHGRF